MQERGTCTHHASRTSVTFNCQGEVGVIVQAKAGATAPTPWRSWRSTTRGSPGSRSSCSTRTRACPPWLRRSPTTTRTSAPPRSLRCSSGARRAPSPAKSSRPSTRSRCRRTWCRRSRRCSWRARSKCPLSPRSRTSSRRSCSRHSWRRACAPPWRQTPWRWGTSSPSYPASGTSCRRSGPWRWWSVFTRASQRSSACGRLRAAATWTAEWLQSAAHRCRCTRCSTSRGPRPSSPGRLAARRSPRGAPGARRRQLRAAAPPAPASQCQGRAGRVASRLLAWAAAAAWCRSPQWPRRPARSSTLRKRWPQCSRQQVDPRAGPRHPLCRRRCRRQCRRPRSPLRPRAGAARY